MTIEHELQRIADALEQVIDKPKKTVPPKVKKEVTNDSAEPVKEDVQTSPEQPELPLPDPETTCTLEDLRDLVKSFDPSKLPTVREVLTSFGASKLGEVKPYDFDKLHKALEDARDA